MATVVHQHGNPQEVSQADEHATSEAGPLPEARVVVQIPDAPSREEDRADDADPLHDLCLEERPAVVQDEHTAEQLEGCVAYVGQTHQRPSILGS
jgi:hypothetical protein